MLLTTLGEMSSKNIRDAQIRFGIPVQSGGSMMIPIVAKPRRGNGFPWVSIPEGVHALKFRHGVMTPRHPLAPGFHAMDPFSKVSTVMTSKHTMFDIPVKKCQSKDNIDVQIDLFVMFRIRDPVLFHDKLSATKLGLVLTASLEEAVRELALNTRHTHVYDLVHFDESDITKRLDKKFDIYGIDISEIVITHAGLPRELELRLQNETTYHSRNRLQIRKQEFDVTVTKHQEELSERRLVYKNERLAFSDEQERERAKISKETDEIISRTEKLLAEIKAEENRIVLEIQEDAKRFVAQKEAERRAVLMKLSAQAQAKKATLEIEASNYETETISKANVQVAQDKSNATKLIADAEYKAAKLLQARRNYELKLLHLDSITQLANNQKVVVSGDTKGNIAAQVVASDHVRRLCSLNELTLTNSNS